MSDSRRSTLVCILTVIICAIFLLIRWDATAQGPPWAAMLAQNEIVMIMSGSCPAGTSQVSALNGRYLLGTTAANGDVGTTGGSATATPTGTISQATFIGTPQNFGTITNLSLLGILGNAALNSPTTYTPAGTISAQTFTGSAITLSPSYTKVIFCSRD